MKTSGLLVTALVAGVMATTVAVAGWSDYLDQLKDSVNIPTETNPDLNLTRD